MTQDELLPDVLLFPPATDMHDHPLVKNSCLILQVRPTWNISHTFGYILFVIIESSLLMSELCR